MTIKKFQFNPFPVNTFVISDSESKECAIIDPGCYWAEEREELRNYINNNSLQVKHLLLTHLHLDHALSVPFCSKTFDVPFSASKKDEFLLSSARTQAASYGLKLEDDPIPVKIDLKEGDLLKLGKHEIHVLEVPGHSPGSLVFYIPSAAALFVGDVLFQGSIGRTDLPGGDYESLIRNIKNKLFTLPANTTVYTGHGPETNIANEQKNNPFFK